MKKGKPNRLLFCALDIGGRIELYTKFLNNHYNNRIISESFVKFKLPEKHYKTDYKYHFQFKNYYSAVQWVISFCFFIYAIFKYAIFYIISGENILTRKLLWTELFIYKLLGKKIVMHFVGADIRNPEYLIWENVCLSQKKSNFERQNTGPPLQTSFQKKLCALSEKYSDEIIVATPDLIQFFKKKDKVFYIPVFIDADKFISELSAVANNIKKENNLVTILHAPSNPPLKGTDYITKIVNELQQLTGNLKVVITTSEEFKSKSAHPPYTITKYKLLELYKESHIVIDQILIGWYGIQSLEALLAGNMVICVVDDKLKNYIYPNCPINIIKQPEELKNVLQTVIENLKQNNTVQNSAKDWVTKYHTIENNKEIQKIFDRLIH